MSVVLDVSKEFLEVEVLEKEIIILWTREVHERKYYSFNTWSPWKKLLLFEHFNDTDKEHLEEDAADVVVVHIVKDLLLRQRPDLQVRVFVVVPLVMMGIMSDCDDDGEGGNRDDDDIDTWSPHSSMMFCSKHAVSAASMQPQYKSG